MQKRNPANYGDLADTPVGPLKDEKSGGETGALHVKLALKECLEKPREEKSPNLCHSLLTILS